MRKIADQTAKQNGNLFKFIKKINKRLKKLFHDL